MRSAAGSRSDAVNNGASFGCHAPTSLAFLTTAGPEQAHSVISLRLSVITEPPVAAGLQGLAISSTSMRQLAVI
jgi:hypothetical protein